MKNNWETKTLGEVCDVVTGSTPKTSNKKFYGDFMMWAGPADLDLDFYIVDTKKKLSQEGVVKGGVRVVPKNSVLMSCIGYIGKLGIAAEDMATNQQINTFIPDNKILDSKFLFYQLKTKTEDFKKRSSQATLAIINKTKCSEVSIEFPELSEQKRIVGILDEKFKAIEELKKVTEAQIQDAKELFESRLSEVFENKARDWSNAKLFDYIKFIDYRGRTPKKTKSGIKLITAKNIKKGYLQNDPEEFIACNDYEAWMTRGIPLKGDILFTTEAPLGNVAKLDTDEKVAFAQRTIIFQMDRKIFDPGFLFYLLLSKPFQTNILGQATGATVLGIKSSLLKKIEISFPKSLDKQKLIFLELYELSEKKDSLEKVFLKKIQDLDELKKSYLEQAFEGKL